MLFTITLAFRILRYLGFFLVVTLPLTVLGIICLAIYLPFCTKNPLNSIEAKLPRLLRFFDCADLYAEFGRNPITYLTVVCPKGRYARFVWIALRNPLNYFSYKYLGVTPQSSIVCLTLSQTFSKSMPAGSKTTVGDSAQDAAGKFYVEYLIDSKFYYEYYIVYKYPTYVDTYLFRGTPTCLRFRLGHKLGAPGELQYGKTIQDVFVISPFKTYSGLQ